MRNGDGTRMAVRMSCESQIDHRSSTARVPLCCRRVFGADTDRSVDWPITDCSAPPCIDSPLFTVMDARAGRISSRDASIQSTDELGSPRADIDRSIGEIGVLVDIDTDLSNFGPSGRPIE